MPPSAAQTISKMAPILAPFQQTTIIVTGYTDNVPIGPELRQQGIENNQQLSLKRAQTVANFLVSQGVKPNLVSARGLGDAEPVASNDTPQGRAQNRRVELTLAGSAPDPGGEGLRAGTPGRPIAAGRLPGCELHLPPPIGSRAAALPTVQDRRAKDDRNSSCSVRFHRGDRGRASRRMRAA